MFGRSSEEILVSVIRRKLDIEFTPGPLCVHGMLECFHTKPCEFEFAADPLKICRHYDEINIHSVNGFNVTVHRQSPNQTPRLVPVQYSNDFGEIARSTVCYRFVDFSSGHVAIGS